MTKAAPLSRQLVAAVLVAALAPLLLVMGLSIWQYQRDLVGIEAFVGTEALAMAQVSANLVDVLVDGSRLTLDRLAQDAATGAATKARLESEVRNQPQIQSLVVTDARGIIRMSDLPEEGRSLADLPHIQAVLRGAAVAYSDVYRSPTLGTLVVSVTKPYRVNGRVAGAVMARMSTPEITRLLKGRLASSSGAVTYVTDRQGSIITHPDATVVAASRNLRENPPVAAGISGQSGWKKYDSTLYNAPRIGGHVPVGDTGWVVVSARETGDRMISASERLRNNLAVALLAGLLAGLVAAWWGRRLTRPLEALASIMGVAQGAGLRATPTPTLQFATVSDRTAEYQVLGNAYNALVGELNNRFEEIMAFQEETQAQNEELQAQNEEIAAQAEELTQQNDELSRLSTEAQAANQMKSEFLANMSHELRTPLNSIIGYTELVLFNKKVDLPERIRRNLDTVLRNGRHLLGLINDILDLSKVEAGKMSLFIEPVDIRFLIQAVVGTTEPLAAGKKLALAVELPADIGTITTDETKLRQILLNLASNAVKFTHEGEVTLAVRRQGEEELVFEVRDTGVGVAPDHQEMIFEEFRQVDASTTREAGGTGLGLAIARKLARVLGGDLTLRSEPGRGSSFTLTIPRNLTGHPTATRTSFPATPVREIEVPQDGKHLVVSIDDDPEMLQLIAEKLKDSPYRVVPASTGESGIQLVQELQPYAVTLDVMMPRMDGWTVLRALKADPATADVPVLILSFVENKVLGFDLGAAAYFTKPIEQADLLATLDRFSGLREGHGQVLVVDDDADARGIYRELLTQEGVRFVEAADGREAIAAAERETPMLVILDLMMPHMDGFEVAAWLRGRPETRTVPIVVVTAKELTPEDLGRLDMVQRVIRKGDSLESLIVSDLRELLDRSGPGGRRPS